MDIKESQQDIGNVGEEIVKELLEEIIEKVQISNHWDITEKGKQTKNEQQVERSWNLISLIQDHAPSRVLVRYTSRDAHVQVLQLKCTKQRASGYCGHYAVHNTLCLLEACHSLNEGAVMGYLDESYSDISYWRRYWCSISQLLVKARSEEAWPWTEDYLYTGDMERSFLRYLMTSDPHLKEEKDNIIVLQYSFGLFQHTFESISQMQDKIDSFLSSPCPAQLVFILGVTNHWLTLGAYKTSKEACHCHTNKCGCGQIHMIYMDSCNVPVIAYSDKGITDHMIKQEKKRIKRKGRDYPKWKKDVIRQAYFDQRSIVNRIARYLSGHVNLREEFVSEYITKMLTSFKQEINDPVSLNGSDLYIPLLLNWLDSHYPVQILYDIIPFLTNKDKYNDKEMFKPLSTWVNTNLSSLVTLSTGITQIDSFVVFLTTIIDLF